jgi:hypothetical protein
MPISAPNQLHQGTIIQYHPPILIIQQIINYPQMQQIINFPQIQQIME